MAVRNAEVPDGIGGVGGKEGYATDGYRTNGFSGQSAVAADVVVGSRADENRLLVPRRLSGA